MGLTSQISLYPLTPSLTQLSPNHLPNPSQYPILTPPSPNHIIPSPPSSPPLTQVVQWRRGPDLLSLSIPIPIISLPNHLPISIPLHTTPPHPGRPVVPWPWAARTPAPAPRSEGPRIGGTTPLSKSRGPGRGGRRRQRGSPGDTRGGRREGGRLKRGGKIYSKGINIVIYYNY